MVAMSLPSLPVNPLKKTVHSRPLLFVERKPLPLSRLQASNSMLLVTLRINLMLVVSRMLMKCNCEEIQLLMNNRKKIKIQMNLMLSADNIYNLPMISLATQPSRLMSRVLYSSNISHQMSGMHLKMSLTSMVTLSSKLFSLAARTLTLELESILAVWADTSALIN